MTSVRDWFLKLIGRQKSIGAAEGSDDGIGADVPIRSSIQDRLRRAPFATRIATVLSGPSIDEGRVFAIRGAWGDGKSSLKNMVIEQLGACAGGVKCLDFNPWQWGDGDAIARALFQQMADKLGGELSKDAGRRAKKLRQYGALLTGAGKSLEKASSKTTTISSVLTNASVLALAGAVSFELPSAAIVGGLLVAASVVSWLIGRALAEFGRDRWSEPLDEIRHSLEKSLRKLERPLVVFVDDIDRLEPDQIRLLFRQVKVNANLPNIVFVMLFQPSIVEAALNPIADGHGRAFLEKIVQANFDLPSVPISMVHAAMTADLARIAGVYATAENGFGQVRWGNILIGCIQPFVSNLRDARRYTSSVAVHLPIHAGRTAFEVNVLDFLALEALRVFEPELHASLFGERDLLLQTMRFAGDRQNDAHRERAEALVSRAPEESREIIRTTVKELFPRLGWAFGGSHYTDGSWDAGWIAEKRVCTTRFFARYFELQTPEGELSESEFGDVIAMSGEDDLLKAALAEFRERGLIPSLAMRLDESVNRLPTENAAVLLPAMHLIAQSLVAPYTMDPFNSPWVSAWRAIIWYVRRLPEPDRGPHLLAALRQTGALSVASVLINLNSPESRKEGGQLEPAVDAAVVQALKDEWLNQVEQLAVEGRLLERPDFASMLFRWRDYTGSSDAPKAWVASAIETDEGFAAMMTRLMGTGTTQSIEDRVASRFDMFERSTIETFFELGEVRRRAYAIEHLQLPPEQAHALEVLRQHLQQWAEAAGPG